MKLQSMATAKHKFQPLVFNPTNQKLIVFFLDELQSWAEEAFGVSAQMTIEHFRYAKMPPHQEKNKPGVLGERPI